MIDKIYLKQHMQLREELKDEMDRYELILNKAAIKGLNMDGMPHGSQLGGDGIFYNTLDKLETERKIKELKAKIEKEYKAINLVVEKLTYPAEKKIMKMRYFQCMDWQEIRASEFGGRWDYYDNMEKYKDKVFKIHGSALKHIKELQEEQAKKGVRQTKSR